MVKEEVIYLQLTDLLQLEKGRCKFCPNRTFPKNTKLGKMTSFFYLGELRAKAIQVYEATPPRRVLGQVAYNNW